MWLTWILCPNLKTCWTKKQKKQKKSPTTPGARESLNVLLLLPTICLSLHLALLPLLRSWLTARARGLRREASGVSPIAKGSTPPPTTSMRQSKLVRESLTAAGHWLPRGVAATRAEKYFSCSTLLVEMSAADAAVPARREKSKWKLGKVQDTGQMYYFSFFPPWCFSTVQAVSVDPNTYSVRKIAGAPSCKF